MILTVTPNPALDHTLRLDEPLCTDAVTRTDDIRFDAGGKGINVSQYLRELGTETLATGFLGGPFGRMLRERLHETDLPAAFVEIESDTRLNTSVLAPEGEYKINHNGPAVGESAVDALIETIREHDPNGVVVAGSLPPGIDTTDIDRIAAAGPWSVAVDVGGKVLRSLSSEYAVCKPNREELAAATDAPIETVADCVRAADRLRERGFERVVASLGPDGAVLVAEDCVLHAGALGVDVADTVGAGDALLAGVLSALDHGESDEAALRTGVALASRVTAVPGTTIPDLGGLDADRTAVPVSIPEVP